MKWEYRFEVLDEMADLNPLGALGWELIAGVKRPDGLMVFQFRRAIAEGATDSPAAIA
ncbi:MAG: hypothetical protein LAP85_10505 [Acidobacteriia bacterium]|nr:hypothetical protein [Terriglobia bacterium]